MANYITIPGDLISKDDLELKITINFYNAIESSSYSTLMECRKQEKIEIIIFDTQVERPQKPVHDIRKLERIAVYFYDEDTMPTVYALRDDFPYLMHINLTIDEFPRSLCIYDEPFLELKLKWSGFRFLEDIRSWLAQAAVDKLHADDQRLEPLLFPSSKYLIVDRNLIGDSSNKDPVPLSVLKVVQNGSEIYFLKTAEYNSELFTVLTVNGEPQVHGIIRKIPTNIWELHEFLKNAQIDLLSILRDTLKKWKDNENLKGITNATLILLIVLPKKRNGQTDSEAYDLYTYKLKEKIVDIGAKLDLWAVNEGKPIHLLMHQPDESKNGDDIKGELLNPILAFDPEIAYICSGRENKFTPLVTAIGLGALGSQVYMNLLRMGFNKWFLIDKDILLPHNLARHALFAESIGKSKAEVLAIKGKEIFNQNNIKGISSNVLRTDEHTSAINDYYKESELIMDMSASITVARQLAIDIQSEARRASLFLNPKGSDGILICEDKKRELRLDFLEMVYYRFLTQTPELYSHLEKPKGKLRYGNSCRDVSFEMRQDLISIHSGILSRGINQTIKSDDAVIKIWTTETISNNVKEFDCPISGCKILTINEWTVVIDEYLINKVSKLRESKLPNETGGVLIGSHDMTRKIVYIVDTIPSPDDSIEWPTVYIRGCKGLETKIKNVCCITDDNLNYIGEWHSHPRGASCLPSIDDKKAFDWLTEEMASYDLPSLMLIVSEEVGIYICTIKN